MKKVIRIISVILIVVCVSFMFCGCQELDQMRKTRGIWSNKKHTEFVLNGKTYKRMQKADDKIGANMYVGNVTEKDVPILLADFEGSPLYTTFDGEAAEVYADVYIREDKYDEYLDLLSTDNPFTFYAIMVYNSGAGFESPKLVDVDDALILDNAIQNATEIDTDEEFGDILMTRTLKMCDKKCALTEDYATIVKYENGNVTFEMVDGTWLLADENDIPAMKIIIEKYKDIY